MSEHHTSSYASSDSPAGNGQGAHDGATQLADPEVQRDVRANLPTPERPSSGWSKWWLIPVVLGVGAIAAVAVYRIRNQVIPEPTAEQQRALSVAVTRATVEPIRAWDSAQGTVFAVRYKHLTFDVAGDVTLIADSNGRQLREGDRVAAGEVLARIDDRELTADLNQARAQVVEAQEQRAAAMADVAQARSQVAQARTQVSQAQAQLEQARTARNLAQTNLERYRQLFTAGAVPEVEFDTRQQNFQDAQAQVEVARSQVQTAREQVDAARAQVDAAQQQLGAATARIETAQAEVEQAQVALEGTRLVAPFDGVVAYLNIRENEQYTPQLVQSRLAGDYEDIVEVVPIVVIDPSEYEVIADVPANLGGDINPGQSALVTDASLSAASDVNALDMASFMADATAAGEVYAVNPAVTPGGRSTEVTIRIAQGGDRLRHGEQVSTWIATAQTETQPVVPLNAIVYRERQPYAFVVNPETNEVEQRSLELGIASVTTRAIAAGIAPGELVVTEGQNRLVDGTPVQIVGDSPPALTSTP